MNRRLLVVDPDRGVRDHLTLALGDAGFTVATAETGAVGVRQARTSSPALIVTELDLPDGDGFDLCREFKYAPQTAAIPILILTARGGELDRVLGFELGAEDYVLKPFNVRELALRIKRILARRFQEAPIAAKIEAGALSLDLIRCEVRARGRVVPLAAKEFKLLALLMQRKGVVHSREQLLREVWNYDLFSDSRTIDTHVRRIRLKLGQFAHYLENVRNLGYRIRDVARSSRSGISAPTDALPA